MRNRLFKLCFALATAVSGVICLSAPAQAATASFEIRGYVPVRCGTELVNGQPTITCNTSDAPVVNVSEYKVQPQGGAVSSEVVTGAITKGITGAPKLALNELTGPATNFQPFTVMEITL